MLGMTLADGLTKVTKTNFKKWHSEGALLLYGAGHGDLNITLSRLNDYGHDYMSEGKQTTNSDISKHDNVYMFSNGCDEFILVVNDMQASQYNRDYFKDTGRNHITVYVVND